MPRSVVDLPRVQRVLARIEHLLHCYPDVRDRTKAALDGDLPISEGDNGNANQANHPADS